MTALFQNGLFQNLWSQALAWTLLNFLWEGAVLGFVAWAGLRLLRRRSANTRYLWGCVCLGLMLASAAGTFILLRPLFQTAAPAAAATLDSQLLRAAMQDAPWPLRARLAFAPYLPWALAVWSLGVVLLTLRLAGAWLWLQRLRYRSVEPAGAEFQMQLNTLIRRLHVDRAVGLFKSALVEAPLVIGWLRPAILVPAAALAGLAPDALEAVLAHELAHIRRHDYLVNLLQSAAEILFFYHPAVWWLSAEIRLERENACDDVAVSSCGDALLYARSLARLEELRGSMPSPKLALASNGGSLMNRIHRLLLPPLPPSNTAKAGLIAALAFSLLGATSYKIAQTPAPKPEESKSQKISKVVVRTADGDKKVNMNVNMDGDVRLDLESKELVKLGPGGSIELKVREGGKLKKFTARKDAKGEVREWTVDGKAAPMTPEDEAWLKQHLKELKRQEGQAPEHRARKIIIKRHGDSEVVNIEGLDELEGLAEFDWVGELGDHPDGPEAERMRHEHMKKIVIDSKRMAKDAEGQAKEAERMARHAAQRAKEIRIIVKKNKEMAEHMGQLGEEMRKKVRVFVDTDDIELPELDVDVAPRADGSLPRAPRVKVLRFGGKDGVDSRNLEIEILKKQIEHMKDRLERLQKGEAAPRIAPMHPLRPMPPMPPPPPSDAPPPPPAPPAPLPPTPPEAPAPGGAI
ncbi:MAG: M56 family metallopeptidase [Holophagaceae bacterium]|nr:M56 family metallopeptidase [Holophagaceae bacterium]